MLRFTQMQHTHPLHNQRYKLRSYASPYEILVKNFQFVTVPSYIATSAASIRRKRFRNCCNRIKAQERVPSSAAEGARDQDSSSPSSEGDAAGEGEPGARWSAWRGGGIMTGESEPGESSDAGGPLGGRLRLRRRGRRRGGGSSSRRGRCSGGGGARRRGRGGGVG